MSELGQDADSEDTDIKEFLIQTLKSDGTLKQIQNQLTAAVYSAFYRQNATSTDHVNSSMHSFMTSENGVEVISLVIDLLHSLKLENTLNVLTYEANLNNYALKRREELTSQYRVNAQSSTEPLLMSILSSNHNSNEVKQLSKAVVLEPDQGNLNCTEAGTTKANHQKAMNLIEPSADIKQQSASFSTPFSAEISHKENNLPTPDQPARDSIIQLKETEKKQIKSPNGNPNESTHNIHKDLGKSRVSESSLTDNTSKLLVNEVIDRAISVSADDNDAASESSQDRLKILSPSTNDSGGSASRATIGSSGAGSRNDVFRAVPGRAENHLRSPNDADPGTSSDIDSEVNNDITVNSSRLGDYDYIEPVRKLT